MLRKQRGVGLIALIAGSLILTACGSAQATATTPTIDANMIYTSAAMTVAAQLTQNAALTPKPSNTPEATATQPIPTADTTLPTLPLPGAATLAPVSPGIPTLTPPAAANPVQPGLPKGYQWISNDPADNTVFVAGTKFDIVWRVKNTGTTTWNTNYTFTHFSGSKFFEKVTYKLRGPVAPGEETSLIVDAIAPAKSGTYYTWWKLKDDMGGGVGDMDLTIIVVQPGETPAAATATVTPTP